LLGKSRAALLLAGTLLGCVSVALAQSKRLITLDEFMNATDVHGAKLSPDGSAAVIATIDSDWQHNRFRSDLWIWKAQTGETTPLTRSGHARAPQWSPDGRYIAFLSDLPLPDDGEQGEARDGPERVWVIGADSGESFALYKEKLDAPAFAGSADGSQIFFSCASPRSKSAEEAARAQWKDVIRWREQEQGDVLLALPAGKAIAAAQQNLPPHPSTVADDALPLPALARKVTVVEDEINELAPDPKGAQIAFMTDSVSNRLEDPKHNEIYLVSNTGGAARRLTHNQARESELQWNADGSKLFFHVGADEGDVETFRSIQGRLYVVDTLSESVKRLGGEFQGSFEGFTLMGDGRLIASGLKGTQTQLYRVDEDHAVPLPGLPGTYAGVDSGLHSSRLLVRYSTLTQPIQVYVATDAARPGQAKAISSFNALFAERAQPEWKTCQWKADDGTTVEGILIYPPHSMGARNLPMLTLIHGGPAEANGDYFGADWYEWANLAAANGWLVFRPNYRGSSGYGDSFMLQIAPHLVSRPGKDILEGVDALVKDGIADPKHLTVGGYSYGGYMTNWLITQTTEFRAAVTGAGAIEHAANWGNDDTSYDDMWYLGGALPWQNPGIYQSEAALFQLDKVRTPTHIVAGNADVRVSYLEDVLLERALEQLQVPHRLLVFPGEGHSLEKDPWHGYIKVREELEWLKKYGGKESAP
jgi:dipeptidyl aminopeptidase/acylaminoacyl peptidase